MKNCEKHQWFPYYDHSSERYRRHCLKCFEVEERIDSTWVKTVRKEQVDGNRVTSSDNS